MSKGEIVVQDNKLIEMNPTEIVKISIGDLTAPVATSVELSKLAIIVKDVFLDLLVHSERDEETNQLVPHPDALAWEKELRLLLKDIHELSKGIQEKVMLKKMDIVAQLYKQATKGKSPQEIIKTVRELESS
jgi:hypothetical protein